MNINNPYTPDKNTHYLVRNRNIRNSILKETDFYFALDVYEALSDLQKIEIREYRQKLRDFINENKDNFEIKGIAWIVFPIAPQWTNIQIPKY